MVEASSGGGAVTVKMNGQKQVLQLKIDAAAVMSLSSSPADVEMLEDLVTAAFNEAGRRADEAMKFDLARMLGGLNLPPGLRESVSMHWIVRLVPPQKLAWTPVFHPSKPACWGPRFLWRGPPGDVSR